MIQNNDINFKTSIKSQLQRDSNMIKFRVVDDEDMMLMFLRVVELCLTSILIVSFNKSLSKMFVSFALNQFLNLFQSFVLNQFLNLFQSFVLNQFLNSFQSFVLKRFLDSFQSFARVDLTSSYAIKSKRKHEDDDSKLTLRTADKTSKTSSKRLKTTKRLKDSDKEKSEKNEINENELNDDQNMNDFDLNDIEMSKKREKFDDDYDSNDDANDEMINTERSKNEIDEFSK